MRGQCFCDNEHVYNNASFHQSQLKKKYQTICFHQERKWMADNIIIVHKIDTNDNIYDLLTKSLSGWKGVQLRSRIMYSENPIFFWEAS